MTPSHFAEHLEVLRKHTRPIPLQHFASGAQQPPASAVAVTFDDGYVDNLLHATPLLERYEVPATAFVTTGRLDQDAEYWWDELERVLLQPGRLPRSLHLVVAGRAYEWDLGEAGSYTADQARRYSPWKAWEEAPTMRHTLYRQLYDVLNPLDQVGQAGALGELRAWADVERAARPTYRSLSTEEVRSLDRSNLIEIGAHTVTHPNLASLTLQAQAREIQQSKARLEVILEHPVGGFAYTFGRQCDYTEQTVARVRTSGFSYACSNFSGLVTPATDRYQLPRMQVHDWDGVAFAWHLNRWFGW